MTLAGLAGTSRRRWQAKKAVPELKKGCAAFSRLPLFDVVRLEELKHLHGVPQLACVISI